MIANKTYNNVINTLKNIGDKHDQIATVTTGDIFDINLEKMEKFALMHINPVNVTTDDFGLTYNFQIFIADLVSEKSDWTEDNFQSANNLSNGQQTLEPFTERFDNLLTGWVFSLSVLVANNFDACIIPAQAGGSGE
jgi:hypothetical protein